MSPYFYFSFLVYLFIMIVSDLIWLVFSFMTERTSVGLNVALGTACDKSDNQMTASEDLQPTISAFGIPEAAPTPLLRSGFLKGLEHRNGSYTASLSPV